MRLALALAALAILSACSTAEQAVQDTVRQEAKQVINGQVAVRFPGVNAAPITDCIVDNATTAEILNIGQAAIVGVTDATTDLILAIAGRPDTLTCITQSQLGSFAL